jgi:hypothetical protein
LKFCLNFDFHKRIKAFFAQVFSLIEEGILSVLIYTFISPAACYQNLKTYFFTLILLLWKTPGSRSAREVVGEYGHRTQGRGDGVQNNLNWMNQSQIKRISLDKGRSVGCMSDRDSVTQF